MNQPRLNSAGFDLFVPTQSLQPLAEQLLQCANTIGGRLCGFDAFDIARIEAGIPRFGVDMDESNLPLEAGIENRGVSYQKGCYIGQEIINRIHTIGHVTKELRRIRLDPGLATLPIKGDKLFKDDKEAGYITSAIQSPALKTTIALGYVRREHNQPGTELTLRTAAGNHKAIVESIP